MGALQALVRLLIFTELGPLEGFEPQNGHVSSCSRETGSEVAATVQGKDGPGGSDGGGGNDQTWVYFEVQPAGWVEVGCTRKEVTATPESWVGTPGRMELPSIETGRV